MNIELHEFNNLQMIYSKQDLLNIFGSILHAILPVEIPRGYMYPAASGNLSALGNTDDICS